MSKKHVRKSAVMCELSDEMIKDLMESVEVDDDVDYFSDDSFGEPNENISFDAIDEEVNELIVNALNEETEKNAASSQLSEPIADQIVLPSTSSTYVVLDNVTLLPDSGDEMEFAVVEEGKEEAATSVATTSAATVGRFKPPKRPRSLLPIFDKSGPNIKPNSGGFMDESKTFLRSQFILFFHKKNGRNQLIYFTLLRCQFQSVKLTQRLSPN